MRILVSWIFCIISLFVYSQKTEIHYVNEYKENCDSISAKYLAHYIFSDTITRKGTVKITTLSGKLLSESEYKNIDRLILNGTSKTYYLNGNVKSIVTYTDNLIHGEITTYYSAGQLKRKDVFEYNRFVSGVCYGLNGQETRHTDYFTLAEYPGGIRELYKFIYTHTYYPEEAIKQGINGTVEVNLKINIKGEVVRAEVAKSVHPLLDEEALRVAKQLTFIIPGKEDGENTISIYTLPIKFEIKK